MEQMTMNFLFGVLVGALGYAVLTHGWYVQIGAAVVAVISTIKGWFSKIPPTPPTPPAT